MSEPRPMGSDAIAEELLDCAKATGRYKHLDMEDRARLRYAEQEFQAAHFRLQTCINDIRARVGASTETIIEVIEARLGIEEVGGSPGRER